MEERSAEKLDLRQRKTRKLLVEALAQLLADFITGLGKEAPLCWSC